MTSLHLQSPNHAAHGHADDMTRGNFRSLPDTFGDGVDRQEKLRDQSALYRTELGRLIFVKGEKRLTALDLYSMDAVDGRCDQCERLDNNDLPDLVFHGCYCSPAKGLSNHPSTTPDDSCHANNSHLQFAEHRSICSKVSERVVAQPSRVESASLAVSFRGRA